MGNNGLFQPVRIDILTLFPGMFDGVLGWVEMAGLAATALGVLLVNRPVGTPLKS